MVGFQSSSLVSQLIIVGGLTPDTGLLGYAARLCGGFAFVVVIDGNRFAEVENERLNRHPLSPFEQRSAACLGWAERRAVAASRGEAAFLLVGVAGRTRSPIVSHRILGSAARRGFYSSSVVSRSTFVIFESKPASADVSISAKQRTSGYAGS